MRGASAVCVSLNVRDVERSTARGREPFGTSHEVPPGRDHPPASCDRTERRGCRPGLRQCGGTPGLRAASAGNLHASSSAWLSSPLPEEEEWDELGELECPLVESVPRVPSLESVPDMEGDELLRSPMACMLDLLFMW